jgi:hypothetical protein
MSPEQKQHRITHLHGRKEVQSKILRRKLCASMGGGEPVIVPPRKVIEVVEEEFLKGIGF